MLVDKVTCPQCHYSFPIEAVLSKDIEERLRNEFEGRLEKVEGQRRAADAEWRKQIAAKDEEVERVRSIERTKQREEFDRKWDAERTKLEQYAAQRAKDQSRIELESVTSQLREKSQKLDDAKKRESALLRKEEALQEQAADLQLQVQRTLAAEREKILEKAKTKLSEEHQLKDAEKDKQLADMKKQIDALQRKAAQGSQQLQGEVLEESLEALLAAAFPTDDIRPVASGRRGGDIDHAITAPGGQQAGRILWEAKNSKTWSDSWLDKARQDQRAAKGEEVIIVSTVLPKGVEHFGQVDGVWVSEPVYAIGLATALRAEIIKLGAVRASNGDRSTKMEQLYGYLCGTEFRQRVEAIVECFRAMQEELEQEKRAMERSWAKRGKQLERVLKSTAGMYGDLQGIIGRQALPTVKPLALPGD